MDSVVLGFTKGKGPLFLLNGLRGTKGTQVLSVSKEGCEAPLIIYQWIADRIV